MVDNNMNVLAETLAKTGLASSTTQAMMMAKNIMGTEKRVSKHFDGKANEINKNLSRKKSYDEEIQDLIQKTSPEKKNFHYMISGYKQAVEKESEEIQQSPEKPEEKEVFNELENQENQEEKEREPSVPEILESRKELNEEVSLSEVQEENKEEESIEPVSPTQIPNPVPEHINVSNMPNLSHMDIDVDQPIISEEEKVQEELKEEKTEVFQNQAIAKAVETAKPVYTDSVADDTRMLKEIMDEQAEEIYSNNSEVKAPGESLQEEVSVPEEPSVPEYTVFNFGSQDEKPMTNQVSEEPSEVEKSSSEEFIVPKENVEKPQQYATEVTEEKTEEEKKEFKNPIPKVNLMNHFKFR